MSLGGGSYTIENKVIPGAYINFVSTERGGATLGERGVGALGLELDWGEGIIIAEKDTVREKCKQLFGYDYDDDKMLAIREFFRHGSKLIAYNINNNAAAATFTYGAAINKGSRGNDLSVVIAQNVDNTSEFDIDVYLSGILVDSQTIGAVSDYTRNYIRLYSSAELETGTYKLSGGSDGTVTGSAITKFCNAIESYSFNAVSVLVDDEETDDIMIEFTKRMREEKGIKFQCVTFNNTGDYEGVVTVYNGGVLSVSNASIIMSWVCGALAGCAVNESLTNMAYDGELSIITYNSESILKSAIKNGYFLFHSVDGVTRVLKDINTLRTFTEEKGEIFQNNQTVRVCDQIATDVAALFCNYYIGKVPNDKAGRNSLWSELVKYHEDLMSIRAIEDFDESDIEVSLGNDKTSVVVSEAITPVNVMDKLYMKVYVE